MDWSGQSGIFFYNMRWAVGGGFFLCSYVNNGLNGIDTLK